MTAVSPCQKFPDDVSAEIDACSGSFACVGGGSVEYDQVCDGSEDCSDGSDELPCY